MIKISRYALLLTLSCLTPVTAGAVTVTDGETYEGLSGNMGPVKQNAYGDFVSKNNTFRNNSATGGEIMGWPGGGGALYDLEGSSFTIENGTFEGNRSTQTGNVGGGAILLYKTKAGYITDSHFTSNNAAQNGGAILMDSVKEGFTVSGSDFTSNEALNGGAVYVTGSLPVFDNVTFTQNHASENGGAVNVWPTNGGLGRSVKINNSTFEGNTAGSRGGGLYAWGTINAENTSFSGNSAAQGGGIYLADDSANILTNVTFKENTAETLGGGLAISNGTVQINNGTFDNNTAQTRGGAISVLTNGGSASSMHTVFIINSDFTDNKAEQDGGAIHVNVSPTAPGLNMFRITSNDGTTHKFSGNRHRTNRDYGQKEEANAIFIENGEVALTTANEGSRLLFNDGIAGSNISKAKVSANGNITFNDKVKNVDLTLAGGELTLNDVETRLTSTDNILDNVKLSLNKGTLNMQNGELDTLNITDFSAAEDVSIAFDADLASGKSDYFNVSGAMSGGLKFDAEHFNVNFIDGDAAGFQLFNKLDNGFSLAGDAIVRFTDDVKYTMTLGENGFVNVARDTSRGLSDAVAAEGVREFRPESPKDIKLSADLGQMNGEYLKVQLDNMGLDGNGHSGLTVGAAQRLELVDIGSEKDDKAVTGFNSLNGGVVRGDAGSEITIVNSSFVNNHAEENGGAVWSDGIVNITATDGNLSRFAGNTAGDNSNAVYMANAEGKLNIKAADGTVTFNDAVNGVKGYEINIAGTEAGKVNFNNDVENVGKVNINGAQVRLNTDSRMNGAEIALNGGALHLDNDMIGNKASFKSLSGGNGVLHIDVDEANRNADQIAVENLHGTVNVIGHNISVEQARAMPQVGTNEKAETTEAADDQIKFAEVATPGDGRFNVLRVENSAYEWNTVSAENQDGSTDWLMAIKKDLQGQKTVVAEVPAYMSLTGAGFEQTRNLVRHIEDQTAAAKTYSPVCNGYYDYAYNGKPLYNVWVSPTYNSASVDSPAKFDADIYGVEAGGDVQQDANNRLGVFASYRHGKYDVNGKNKFFAAEKSSDIDIDSYLAGLYYRYDRQNLWAMATVFGGIQKADLKTSDGIKADSDATELGAALRGGYSFKLSDTLVLEPQIGAAYTMIDWDDINDGYKNARYGAASLWELEAGVKLEKTMSLRGETAKWYIKPSIIKTFADNDKVDISGLNSIHTMDDNTLGRIAGGVVYQLNNRLNVYGNAGYTFGDDYENVSADIGLSYAF